MKDLLTVSGAVFWYTVIYIGIWLIYDWIKEKI